MKYTEQQILQLLIDHYTRTGKLPTCHTFTDIHPNVVINRFGSWLKALYAAKLIDYNVKPDSSNEVRTCRTCEKDFVTTRRYDRKFCSVTCSNVSRRSVNWKQPVSRKDWIAEQNNKSRYTLVEADWNTIGWDTKRKRVIIDQDNKCAECDLQDWRGHKLSLEVDHIDGDNKNDTRENLRALCPNCHSCTSTWRGRNVSKNRIDKVSDLAIIEALSTTTNIRQALIKVGMVAKGANYKRAKLLLEQMKKE